MARKVSDNARNAFKMLQGMGYKPHVAAGLVGNLMQESGWDINTSAVGDNGNAFGFVQWNGPRRRAFKSWAAQNGYPETGLGTQIAYLDHEMKTSERGAYEALMKAKDVSSAAVTGSRKFWRPGLPHNKKRARYAQAVLTDAIKTGLISGGGGADQVSGGSGADQVQPRRMTAQQLEAIDQGATSQPRRMSAEQLDAMDAPPAEPGFAQQVVDYVGDNAGAAVQAVGDFAVDNAQQFVEGARRGFGAMTNEFYSGGQRVDPSKVDLSTSIGFLEQEVGGEPVVAGSNAAEILEGAESVLDEVAPPVSSLIVADSPLAVAASGIVSSNLGTNCQMVSDPNQ